MVIFQFGSVNILIVSSVESKRRKRMKKAGKAADEAVETYESLVNISVSNHRTIIAILLLYKYF